MIPSLDVSSAEPETILHRRLTKRGNSAVVQVLVKWSSLPADAATREDYYVLKERYPSVAAWGQAGSQGGDSVMPDDSGTSA